MNRFAYSIFCDDIRYEVNNKSSYIGIMGNLMYIPTFPAVLPKLCVSVTANTTHDNPFKALQFKGTLGETVLFDVALEKEQLEQMHEQAANQIDDAKGLSAQAMFVLSPLHIQEPGKIKISVIADGVDLECNGMQISPAPEGMQII
ncbi:DUF6941 family protein [Pseudomonas sp. MWU318]|uniref:DUF6941 family protein n=1 Tax=Pseudomonas sp. MWU318 TaxID=2802569 RepID=UPI0019297815|nr:hypothetical protein [Pseudomonas sp. MWU318]